MDDLDHFIKEKLRVKYYLRYMDDFILIHPDKLFLQDCLKQIAERVGALELLLNEKTTLYPLHQGVRMMRWRFVLADNGKILRFMDNEKLGKQRRKMRKLWTKEQAKPRIYYLDTEQLADGVNYEQEREFIKVYVRRLREWGVECIGQYTDDYRWRTQFRDLEPIFDTLWIAHWGTNSGVYEGQTIKSAAYTDKIALHQYTSYGYTKVAGAPGIDHRIDLNRLTGVKPLSWFTGRTYEGEPIPVPDLGYTKYVACYKPDGTPVCRSIYGKSRTEVASQMRETLRQIEQDEYVPPVRLTVGEWMHEWLRVYCLSSKKLSTCTGYEITISQHICPYIGRVPLQDLKPFQIQETINQLVKEGKAPSTIRKVKVLLHAALEQAIDNGIIVRNVSSRTVLPKMEQKEIRFFTLEEQKRFIDALPDSTGGRALYFILGTGIRAGELAGLRWSDIDGDTFTVNQTIQRIRDFTTDADNRSLLHAGTPKTKAGRRTIPMPPKMQEVLQIQRRRQRADKIAAGRDWVPNDLVFCTETGTPYEGRNLARVLHRTLKEIGLPPMGVHALRHPYVKLKTKVSTRTNHESYT